MSEVVNIIALEKARLRREVLAKVRSMTAKERGHEEGIVYEKFFGLSEYGGADVVGLYGAAGHEVATLPMMERIWADGKQVAVPRTAEHGLEYGVIASMHDCVRGTYGIPEPQRTCVTLAHADIPLVVVPGVAWDSASMRLGRGGGWYDRFLDVYRGYTVSLAYTCQRVEMVPMDAWDRGVRCVVWGD